MDTIGLVGFGAMGSALYERLRLAETEALVYDPEPSAAAAARAQGATIASSPAEIGRVCSVIDVIVRTDEQMLDCMCGAGGLLEGAARGTLLLLHSSVHPKTTRHVADAAREHGVAVMDACAMGTPPVVRAGGLIWLVGGQKDLLDRATPHLLRMGKQVLYMGPIGAANVAKLIGNLVTGAERLVLHEALQIGQAAGIPYPQLLDMMRTVPHVALVQRWENTFDPAGTNIMPQAGTNTLSKDMPLALDLAHDYGLSLPITEELINAAQRVVEANT